MIAASLREHLRVAVHKQLAHIRESLIRVGFTVRQEGEMFSVYRGERVIAQDMRFGELLVSWRAMAGHAKDVL